MDNHDVKRIAHDLKTQPDEEIIATVISMLTYTHLAPGIPLFYYGTESLLKSG